MITAGECKRIWDESDNHGEENNRIKMTANLECKIMG